MRLVVFGLGYSSQAFVRRTRSRWREVVTTVRSRERAEALSEAGLRVRSFPGDEAALAEALASAEALLVSVPPGPEGDPVLRAFQPVLAAASGLTWIGYLSTVGVYGDRGGGWVDEETPALPTQDRSRERLAAEESWLAFGRGAGKAVQVFRLAGIYGPGRSAFERLAEPGARRVIKPGQGFNRIHVDDIAAVLEASLSRPRAGGIYNVADDEPSPPDSVIEHAAALLGRPPPPAVTLAEAGLSPMAASFYADNKRVRNARIKDELGVRLAFPTFRDGLRSILAGMGRSELPPPPDP